MPFETFDRSSLSLSTTEELKDLINYTKPKPIDSVVPEFNHKALPELAKAITEGREKYKATVLLMFGANLLTSGNSLYIIELMKKGLISHLATNGMGSVYDFEYAAAGGIYERKDNAPSALWDVTGKMNDILTDAYKKKMGWGEAIGKYIWENNLPNKEESVQAMAYHLGIPFTVHVGIGCDILHQYPNCCGEALGFTSYTDFLIYTDSITRLEKGVFLDFGSAVAGPEVYLKALAMARNVAKQKGEKIVDFHTAVFDIMPIDDSEGYNVTPPKSDPRYYFRPWKTILARSVADGGHSHYINCPHDISFPALANLILSENKNAISKVTEYKQFDRSKLSILPLNERIHDINISIIKDINDEVPEYDNPDVSILAEKIVKARRDYDASVLMMYGAHVIRTGNGMFMIDLMKRGLINHFATNGAGSIHDFEFAMIGNTCESVAKYISEGQFGLWKETGYLNDAINAGAKEGLGWGESVGKYIWENNFPYREKSVLAMGYHLQVPCTVHIGVGNDILHEHPNCIGENMGAASYKDFLIYADTVSKMNHGVFMCFGSAIAGPEVFLNALDMAQNASGRNIKDITTAAFDMIDIDQSKGFISPEKAVSDARFYYRPWRNVLCKNAKEGGTSFYFKGDHKQTVTNVAKEAVRLDELRKQL